MERNGLQVTEKQGDGAWTLEVSGELDLRSAPDLCARLTARRGARLVVDLSRVEFCDSAGLRALVGEAREARFQGGSLSVVAPPQTQLRRLLEMTGLIEVLGVHADLGHAMASA